MGFLVKSTQAKVAELYKSACLQSAIIFRLDNKLIAEVDILSNILSTTTTHVSSISIALNLLVHSIFNKQK